MRVLCRRRFVSEDGAPISVFLLLDFVERPEPAAPMLRAERRGEFRHVPTRCDTTSLRATDGGRRPSALPASGARAGAPAPRQARASTTDPQARVMTMPDGGWRRPDTRRSYPTPRDRAVDVETTGSDMGQLRVTCGALLAACGPRPCQHLVRNLRPASGRSTTPCDWRACRIGLGERRRWVFATSSASSAEIRGRHAEHARERHGRTRDCRSPPQNAVRPSPAGPSSPRPGRSWRGSCGRSKAKKCAVRSTPPITTLASPKSAWAYPGRVVQRHEHRSPPPPILADVVLHDGVATDKPGLVAQALEHPLGGVALLSVLAEIIPQPLLDDLGEPVQLRPPDRCGPPVSRRHREAQHLLHALARDPERRAASLWLMPSRQARRSFR